MWTRGARRRRGPVERPRDRARAARPRGEHRAQGTGAQPRPVRPRSTRSRACASTSRCRTSTGRSTTSCPSPWRPRPCPAPGCGCGSPASSSTAGCSSGSAASDHTGRIERIAKVVSPDPVLAPEVAELARAVADRWAGTLADVLRAAVPPRHAAAESAVDALGTPDRPLVGAPRARRPRPLGRLHRWCRPRPEGRRPRRRVHGPAARAACGLDGRARLGPGAGDRAPGGGRRRRRPRGARRRARRARRRPARRLRSPSGSEPRRSARSPPTSARPPATAPSSRYAVGTCSVVVGTRAAVFAPVARPRPRRPLGRRRRQPRRAARALLARARGARPARHAARAPPWCSGPPPARWRRRPSSSRAGRARWSPRAPRCAAARRGSVTVGDDDLARDEAREVRAAARTSRGTPRAKRWPAARSSCRCRAAATCRRSRARPAGSSPGAGTATDRSASRAGTPRRSAAGAGASPATGRARPAGHAPARRVGGGAAYGGGARPRVPRGPGAHVGPRPLGRAACWTTSTASRPWSSPRPAPSRGPRAGTPRRCCSTAVSPSTGPTCARPRRPCAAGRAAASLVRPAAEGGVVVLVADPALAPVQAVVRSDPAGFAARELAEREAAAPPARVAASPRPSARPATSTTCSGTCTCPTAPWCSAPCRSPRYGAPAGATRATRARVPCSWRRAPTAGCGARRSAEGSGGGAQRPQGGRAGRGPGRPGRSRLGLRPATRGAGAGARNVDWSPLHTLPRRLQEPSVAVKPIRLFGDPVLTTPAAEVTTFDKELRKLVKDLTDTMLEAPGAGLAAPQLGVSLRVFTYDVDDEIGHLINPVLDLSEEMQEGDEGCLSVPDLAFNTRRSMRVVAKGMNMHGEPVVHRGHRAARPLHPARDRPPRRHHVHRPARRRDAQGGHEGHPRGGVVRPARAPGEDLAALDLLALALGGCRTVRLVFAGTPEVALPSLARPASPRSTRWSRSSRVPTRPPAAAARCRRRPVAALAAEHGIEVLKPEKPRDPDFLARLRRARARLLPRRRLRRARAARRARHPAARLGQPALLAAAGVARRGAGAARGVARRRRHRRLHLPARGGPGHRPGVRRGHRDGAPHRHQRRPARPAGGVGRRAARRDAWTASRHGALVGGAAAADGVSLAPKITVDDARVDWSQPGGARRPPGPRLHAAPRRLDDVRRRAAQARARRRSLADDLSLAPGELARRQEPRARRHGDPRGRRSARCARRARRRWPRPTGRAACAPSRASCSARACRPDGRGPAGTAAAPSSGAATVAPPTRRGSRRTTSSARCRRTRPTPTSSRRRCSPSAELHGRDAAFTTTLAYGTLRRRGFLDAVLAGLRRPSARRGRRSRCSTCCASGRSSCSSCAPRRTRPSARPCSSRASWAASRARASSTRCCARSAGTTSTSGSTIVAPDAGADPVGHLAVVQSHPRWIVQALHDSLSSWRGSASWADTEDLLAADNENASVTLVARPGRGTVDDLLELPAHARRPLVAVRGGARGR